MKKLLQWSVGVVASVFVLNVYAIEVSVQSPSDNVSALGFTVNGKNYGKAGHAYSKSDMPAGSYQFGMRVGGLFSPDIGCSLNGKESVYLKTDTRVTLNYDGGKCRIKLN